MHDQAIHVNVGHIVIKLKSLPFASISNFEVASGYGRQLLSKPTVGEAIVSLASRAWQHDKASALPFGGGADVGANLLHSAAHRLAAAAFYLLIVVGRPCSTRACFKIA
jgi:hypothetical protein